MHDATPIYNPPSLRLREISMLSSGVAILEWPAEMSAESVQELDEWLTFVIKKLRRRYAGETMR